MKSKIEKFGKVSITVEKDYWDKNKAYNRLTIVERQGTSTAYLSRKVVPIGVEITDRNYWITISKWADIPYEIVQEFGDSTEVVISQKVVTLKIEELEEAIDGFDSFKTLINNINNQINDEGGIEERLSTVEELAEISIDGGEAQIATASDFDNPTTQQRAKIPTVGALVDVNLIPKEITVTPSGTQTIKANTLYKFGTCSALTIAFETSTSFANAIKEYMFEFTVENIDFTLTLPIGVQWAEEPDFSQGYTYQVSILDDLAIYAEFNTVEANE